MSPALDIDGVDFSYGGAAVLRRCTFAIDGGQVTGLIGPNGAGKSTLIEVISGGLRPAGGRIAFDGSDITGASRARVASLGIIRTFQNSRELGPLPVVENVMLAARDQRGESLAAAMFGRRAWRAQERQLRERARGLLDWVGLGDALGKPASALSGGQRRLLDMARALMAEPKLLLLDEPTAGVYPAVVRLMAGRIREIAGDGITVLVVAHNMAFLESVADDVVVMDQGTMLTRGSVAEVRGNSDVVSAYLGVA